MELLASSIGVVLFGLVLAQLAPEGAATDQEQRFAYFIGSCSICCFIVVPGYITACCVPERPEYCLQPGDMGTTAEGGGGNQTRAAAAIMAKGGEKTAFFAPFIYKMHYFTKTGSGQT